MADTIGRGNDDVERRHRRRRLPHVPGRVAWPAAAAIVAAVVLTPLVGSHFADQAAARLQGQWSLATAYDDARQSAESRAMERAAAADGELLRRLLSAARTDEALALTRIANDVGGHRSWSAGVHRAQVAARTALAAEVKDLRAAATRPAVFFSSSYFSRSVMSERTLDLIVTADRLVAACALRHHAHARPPGAVGLPDTAALLARLGHVTDQPVPLRLAVEGTAGVDIWNLHSGTIERKVPNVHAADGFATPRRVGASLLVEPAGRWLLVPAAGGHPIRLPPADRYLAAGDGALWQVTGSMVRRLDGLGRPSGRGYALPTGYEPPFAASADALLVTRVLEPFSQATPPAAWLPKSGHVLSLSGACDANAVAARHVVAYLLCNAPRAVAVMDARTGAVRRLRLPNGLATLGLLVLSPDGRRLATQVDPAYADDPRHTTLAVIDVATGRVDVTTLQATPLAWSTDGSLLVVDVEVDPDRGAASEPLAYWSVAEHRAVPIRIPTFSGRAVATLPP